MFTFNVGDRAFVLLTAGNLATSQAVYHQLEKDISANDPEMSLNLCEDLEQAASYIGKLIRAQIKLVCTKIKHP